MQIFSGKRRDGVEPLQEFQLKIGLTPESGRIPLTYPNDRDALAAALMTIRPYTADDIRIVHIKNTLELTKLMVSKGCLGEMEGQRNLEIGHEDQSLEFDQKGNLISPFARKG